jgi:ligand-binding sensor domain-containing protein
MKIKTIKISFLLLPVIFWVTSYPPVFSQDNSGDFIITPRYFTPNDGLASREVFCAIQDNDGFMWFGTRNGLNRYDGESFKLFTKQKDSLAENKIIQLARDNNNHLFIVYGQSRPCAQCHAHRSDGPPDIQAKIAERNIPEHTL